MADKEFNLTLTVPGRVVRACAERQVEQLISPFSKEELEQVGLGTDRKINAFIRQLAADPYFQKQLSKFIREAVIVRGSSIHDFYCLTKVFTRVQKALWSIDKNRCKNDELAEAIDLLNMRGYDVVRKS